MHRMPRLTRRTLAAACALALAAGSAAAADAGAKARFGVVTMLDGDGVVLRDDDRLAAAEGVALQPGDVLATGPKTRLLRVETPGGLSVALGPDTRALVAPALGAGEGSPTVYLLSGWAKVAAPGQAASIAAAQLSVDASGGTVVVSVLPDTTIAFAEAGPLRVRPHAVDTVLLLQSGEMLAWAPGNDKPRRSPRPSPLFVQQMPRPFMDPLPSRLARFQGAASTPEPKVLGGVAWSDAQPWIDGEPAVRRWSLRRWRALAREPEFRRGLAADMRAHPEWEVVLHPTAAGRRAASSAASASPESAYPAPGAR